MFSTPERLKWRTGKNPVDRFKYLELLCNEFRNSSSSQANKEQVLANLANFGYDPINYNYFRTLKVIDIFLDVLREETSTLLIEFAIKGICNVCLDKQNKEYIIANGGIELAVKCLSSDDENTLLTAITTLMFLITPETKPKITNESIVDFMLKCSVSENKRLSNLATVFLEEYCSIDQIKLKDSGPDESEESTTRSFPPSKRFKSN